MSKGRGKIKKPYRTQIKSAAVDKKRWKLSNFPPGGVIKKNTYSDFWGGGGGKTMGKHGTKTGPKSTKVGTVCGTLFRKTENQVVELNQGGLGGPRWKGKGGLAPLLI